MADYRRRLVLDVGFDRALNQTLEAFRAEGLETIARIDLREHFRRTLGHDWHDLRRYLLLQVWSADLALNTYQRNPDGEALLPASFVIDELANGKTAITASEPLSWLLLTSPNLAAFADEQDARVARVMMRLQPSSLVPVVSALPAQYCSPW